VARSPECRDKANALALTEVVFVGPGRSAERRGSKQIGKYYGPPATEMDGSRSRELRLRLHQQALAHSRWSKPTQPWWHGRHDRRDLHPAWHSRAALHQQQLARR
jgi:hypothetical protein